MSKSWYEIKAAAKAGAPAEVYIYDEIGRWGVSASAFARDLKGLGEVSDITLRIGSPGGAVLDGIAIYNMLKDHAAKITVRIDSYAGSIASVIAMAGDTVIMPANTFLMIHNPAAWADGEADVLRDIADLLDKMRANMIAAYAGKSGQTAEEIGKLMDATTWLTAAEAKDLGFADEVAGEIKMAAKFDLKAYASADMAPKALVTSLTARKKEPAMPATEKTAEEIAAEAAAKTAADKAAAEKAAAESTARADAAAIVAFCAENGAAHLAAGFITAGASMETVKAKINVVGEIKTLVGKAEKTNPAITSALADEFIANGFTIDQARAALLDKMVDTQSPEIAASHKGGTAPVTKADSDAWAGAHGKANAMNGIKPVA